MSAPTDASQRAAIGVAGAVPAERLEDGPPHRADVGVGGEDDRAVRCDGGDPASAVTRGCGQDDRPGARLPLHATGVGKVLLAHAPQDVQERVFRAIGLTDDHPEIGEIRRALP